MTILFSDEEIFDLGGIYNNQNDRIWAVNREEAKAERWKKTVTKVSTKSDVWLAVCSEGVAPLVLFEKGTRDHHRHIKEVLSVTLRYQNSKFGNNWIFQQDNRTSHTHQETQDWCCQHFPSFIIKDTWLANTPDLNPLDYCIWEEFAQAISWNKVTWKSLLIAELKLSVKKIRLYVVRKSCSVWTNHLYHMTQNDENYLRE